MKALHKGLHVFLFSDNVPLEQERAIKALARKKDLLVMGPDCGTAIISGTPLGFANVVKRGDISLVGASGTGLQEVSCQIDALEHGIRHAIGTGGHDVSAEIGGSTMRQAVCQGLAPQARLAEVSDLGTLERASSLMVKMMGMTAKPMAKPTTRLLRWS